MYIRANLYRGHCNILGCIRVIYTELHSAPQQDGNCGYTLGEELKSSPDTGAQLIRLTLRMCNPPKAKALCTEANQQKENGLQVKCLKGDLMEEEEKITVKVRKW